MPLAPTMKKQLKVRAQRLRPVVLIGNRGLTETVNQEIDRALHDHELIKIRIQAADRELRKEWLDHICEVHQAESIQRIGCIGVIYRKNQEKN